MQRGENSFCALAKSAQDRGAVAVVVYDNRSSAMVMSAGEGTESHGIFIPVMMVQSTDGKALHKAISQAATEVTIALGTS